MSEITAFTMPKWGIEMEEGVIREWHAEVGQTVNKGDILVVIETDKIANEVELEYSGLLRRRIGEDGDVFKVGALIAVFAPEDVSDGAVDAFVADFKAADAGFGVDDGPAGDAPEAAAGTADGPAAPDPVGGYALDLDGLGEGASEKADTPQAVLPAGISMSPKAKELALALGVDLTDVTGSGRNGRFSLQDVEQAAKAQGLATKADGGAADEENSFETIKLSGMRRAIVKRLSEANRTIPHFYLRRTVGLDALLARRQTLKDAGGAVPSINDYLIKVCAVALQQVPDVNVHFVDDTIRRFAHADIAVAVAVPGGLVTPVVRRAEAKPVAEIAAVMQDLAGRARAEKLDPHEFQGGTFSLSNLGMYGVTSFDAVINPPMGAILAAGSIERVAREDGRFESVMALTLSCDHRAIDGALGGRFLAALAAALEAPETL